MPAVVASRRPCGGSRSTSTAAHRRDPPPPSDSLSTRPAASSSSTALHCERHPPARCGYRCACAAGGSCRQEHDGGWIQPPGCTFGIALPARLPARSPALAKALETDGHARRTGGAGSRPVSRRCGDPAGDGRFERRRGRQGSAQPGARDRLDPARGDPRARRWNMRRPKLEPVAAFGSRTTTTPTSTTGRGRAARRIGARRAPGRRGRDPAAASRGRWACSPRTTAGYVDVDNTSRLCRAPVHDFGGVTDRRAPT